MTATRLPVLTVRDPSAALDWFARLPGATVDRARGEVRAGTGHLLVIAPDDPPDGLRARPFDHLAFAVGDLDALLRDLADLPLHPAYTPDGPREIAEFWDAGVRFAFLMGPEGVPVELCARRGTAGAPAILGLDHLGLRVPDTEAEAAALASHGARLLARHTLGAPPRPVRVAFLAEGPVVWEVFDEPAPTPPPATGWIGTVARA